MTTSAFSKSLRLLNASDYKAVFDDAPLRSSHSQILVLARLNQGCEPRLGLVIAKKNVRLAVQRNRIKRILRETFRLKQQSLQGIDAVVLARRNLDALNNEELHKLFNKQWDRVIKNAAKQRRKDAEKTCDQ